MDRDVALRIDGMLRGALGHLDGVAHYMKDSLSAEEFGDTIKNIGAAMGELVELSGSLHHLFPDIVPPDLRPD